MAKPIPQERMDDGIVIEQRTTISSIRTWRQHGYSVDPKLGDTAMKTMNHSPIIAALLLALSACGGGSSPGNSNANANFTTPVTVPGIPTNLTATAGDGQISIAFDAPAALAGAAITGYTASCTAASAKSNGSSPTSPVVVAGLTNGTAYTCVVAASSAGGFGAASAPVQATPQVKASASSRFKLEVWADNWFSAYVDSNYVGEDSVPITTEKSFNSQTLGFEASYPFDLNFIVKDYKQNDTGLEYIGTPNQQIGDGGFIMQLTDTTSGKVIAVSGSDMRCKVIHKAPLRPACATESSPTVTSCGATIEQEPANWKQRGYDTSGWEAATTYTAAEVGVKEGYFDIPWNNAAKLVWTSDLKADNTLLCKVSVAAPSTTTSTTKSAFSLSMPGATDGGTLSSEFTCDAGGTSPPLTWANPPAGTREYALLMSTLPGDGSTKWNWVLYGIPASTTALTKGNAAVGVAGVGSDGPTVGYQPPCSQGPGTKNYSFTLYALSASPTLTSPAGSVTGAELTKALSFVTLGSASLNLGYARNSTTTITSTASANCTQIGNSLKASTTGSASVTCDSTYAYVASNGLATHTMMDGITATNLQVPTAQNFYGSNAWKIPLTPAIAPTTTSAVDGPIGIAINGVPIFNPCKQGGCQNGDTKVLGELDVCNGHAGRGDDYHYHAAPTCLMAGQPAGYWDTHPLGWALDGYAIYGYNDADGTLAVRDTVCGGNTKSVPNGPSGYSYHVTDASPYVLSCFRGTPSPDLANQGSKFSPMRQPPVTPFAVSGMTLVTDPKDGYQVLQFTSGRSFTTTETGNDSYANAPGTYQIRYKPVTGSALTALLALPQHAGRSACWSFQFHNAGGAVTQPDVSYCR